MAEPAPLLEGPDIYPWDSPTDAQKAYFDALPVTEQWRLVDAMLEAIDTEPAFEDLDWGKIKQKARNRLTNEN